MAKNRPVIAIDIDEVLSSQLEAMRLFINEHYGYNHSSEDYLVEADYWGYWETLWGVDEQEALRRERHFINSGGLQAMKPVIGSLDSISKLKKRYELVIVTSRRNEYADITHKWLDSHFPSVFAHVKFTSLRGQQASLAKAKTSKEIGADYLIDDNLEHCIEAAKSGIKAILFGEYGWNRGREVPKEITKVKDWQEVLDYFERQD